MQLVVSDSEILMTPEAVAQRLGVTPGALNRYRMRGVGPAYVKMGNAKQARVRYRRADVEAFIASHVRGAGAESARTR